MMRWARSFIRELPSGPTPSDIETMRLADGILASELLARERLIDHHDAFAVRGVVRVERAAGHQRHAERLEIAFRDRVILRLRRFTLIAVDPSAHAERVAPRRGERQRVRRADRFHFGGLTQAIEQRAVELRDLCPLRIRGAA